MTWLSSLPFPELTPVGFLILLIFGPLIFAGFAFLVAKVALWISRNVVPVIVSQFVKPEEEKKFLLLTFPADTGKSAYATQQLYSLFHSLSRQLGFWESIAHRKNLYSLELVSTKKDGIRYVLGISPKYIEIVRNNLLSYLSGIKIAAVDDYLPDEFQSDVTFKVNELSLSSHFALPLKDVKVLSEHDPISYLTGHMTKLKEDEYVAVQMVVTPVLNGFHHDLISEMKKLRKRLYQGKPLTDALQKSSFQKLVSLPIVSWIWFVVWLCWKFISITWSITINMLIAFADTSGKSVPWFQSEQVNMQETLNPYEQELATTVKAKIDQPLFESSIRIMVAVKDPVQLSQRMNGIAAAFGQLDSPYQRLEIQNSWLPFFNKPEQRLESFINRSLSRVDNPIVSTAELSDLFHFPYTDTTKTEGMVKSHSKDLPAPLSVKNNGEFDVIFGKNDYGNSSVDIGLTDDDRSRHVSPK